VLEAVLSHYTGITAEIKVVLDLPRFDGRLRAWDQRI
jgi:hypothetical protein